MIYTYDPEKIPNGGVDKMRFELGDTHIEEGPLTAALCDEEYQAALNMHPTDWKRAKLDCLRSICMRFAYEVDTKEGPLSFALSDRAKLWKKMLDDLENEINSLAAYPRAHILAKPPYFRTGMHTNEKAGINNDQTAAPYVHTPRNTLP